MIVAWRETYDGEVGRLESVRDGCREAAIRNETSSGRLELVPADACSEIDVVVKRLNLNKVEVERQFEKLAVT